MASFASSIANPTESPLIGALCALVPEIMCQPITKALDRRVRDRARIEFVAAYSLQSLVARYAKTHPPQALGLIEATTNHIGAVGGYAGYSEHVNWQNYVGLLADYQYRAYASGDMNIDRDFTMDPVSLVGLCSCDFCGDSYKVTDMVKIYVIWRRHAKCRTIIEVLHAYVHTAFDKACVVGPRRHFPRITTIQAKWTCFNCDQRLGYRTVRTAYLATYICDFPQCSLH
jgi:hypothetical protein